MDSSFLTFTIGDVATILLILFAGFKIYHQMDIRINTLEVKVDKIEEKI